MREKNINKQKVEKLAIFDLDGTLYYCNSHIEILNSYYRIPIFNWIPIKIFSVLFRHSFLMIIFKLFERIPDSYISTFKPPFRKSATSILKSKIEEGYYPVIVSNAPIQLVECAAKRLNIDWLKAEVSKKNEVILMNFSYDYLFVCTDNITDMNILDIADEKVIYQTKRTKKIFQSRYPKAIFMEE